MGDPNDLALGLFLSFSDRNAKPLKEEGFNRSPSIPAGNLTAVSALLGESGA